MDTVTSIPTNLKLDEEFLQEAAKKDVLPAGFHRVYIIDATGRVNESDGKMNGYFEVSMQGNALADPNDPNSRVQPRLWMTVYVPVVNPDVPGHSVAKWVPRMCNAALSALCDDVPAAPERINGRLFYNGNEISNDDEETCKAEAYRIAGEKALELLHDPSDLVESVAYIKMDGETSFVKGWFRELPEGAMLADLSASDKAGKLKAKSGNGAAGRATPAKKKKAKKRKGRR